VRVAQHQMSSSYLKLACYDSPNRRFFSAESTHIYQQGCVVTVRSLQHVNTAGRPFWVVVVNDHELRHMSEIFQNIHLLFSSK
jgi:hypothetical protein